jgi:hypothetical protein
MDSANWQQQIERQIAITGELLTLTRFAAIGLPGFGEIERLDALMAARLSIGVGS